MTYKTPKEYGFSVGQFRPIPAESFAVSLEDGGIDKSMSASQLNVSGTPSASDVRFIGGGFATDYATALLGAAYAGAGDKTVVHVTPYEKVDKSRFLMRCRPIGWDRWNGTNWLTLNGALTAVFPDRLYSTIQDDRFIVANGYDRLKSWDGDDTHSIQDLSADAPYAQYVTRIGTRLLAARVRIGGGLRPNVLAWCADGNIYNWSNSLLGAGSAEPYPEGAGKRANYITGLSTLARGAVIYRQSAIGLGLLTGQGEAPFRFTTVDFSHGTESPYSIANGGMELGDFFLGSDYMPYIFNGESAPMPIGAPIHDELLRTIADLGQVYGAMDASGQEYWLAIPTAVGSTLSTAWVFDVRRWATRQKISWRKRTMPANTKSIGFANIVTVSDPIVDTVAGLVDLDVTRVDDYGRDTGPDRVVFGDNAGQVAYIDKATPLTTGTWMTKQFTHPQGAVLTVDRTRIKYTSTTGATIAVSASVDGGATFSAEKMLTLPASTIGPLYITTDHRVTGRSFHIRIRPTTGFVTITELEITYQNLGTGNG